MLNSILSDSRLSNKHYFSIVLLPPISSCPKPPYAYDYLANHVVHIPFHLSKETKGPLETLSGINLKFSHGCIIFTQSQSNILYSKLLYNMHAQCTHLILYLDNDISIEKDPYRSKRLRSMIGDTQYFEFLPLFDLLVAKFSTASSYCYSIRQLQSCMQDILETGYHYFESLQDEKLNHKDLCRSFENMFMEETYDIAFFKITQILLDQDQMLTSILQDLDYLDFSQISSPEIKDERAKVKRATATFEKIGSLRTPLKKLDCLLATIENLTEGEGLSTDGLVPLFLMTMIQSKLPHLLANLCFMKDFTFKTNVSRGAFGYSLSTLEACLSYIPTSNIHELSLLNQTLWASIRANDLVSFEKYDKRLGFEPRDQEGNNPLLACCLYGQTDLVSFILSKRGCGASDRNDRGMTPLMCAIKGRSNLDLLLKDRWVTLSMDAVDNEGDSVLMYVCRDWPDLALLKQILSFGLPPVRNQRTTALHLAAHYASTEFVLYLVAHLESTWRDWKDDQGQTVFHVCRNKELIGLLGGPGKMVDNDGRCPAMVWAMDGRLDLVMGNVPMADDRGRTVLHVVASRLSKGVVGDLDRVVSECRDLVHIQDWPDHNTALHLALESATPASMPLVMVFVKLVCEQGGSLDVMNAKGERPMDLCRMDLLPMLDGFISSQIESNQLTWHISRFVMKHQKIHFMIQSSIIGRPETNKNIIRGLEEFFLLRRELLSEQAELFLPPLADLIDPTGLPMVVTYSILSSLESFMDWILKHPVLSSHPLVYSFVRSSVTVEKSKKKLVSIDLGQDAACFFRYIFDTILPLKTHYSHLLTTARRIMNIKQVDLRAEWMQTLGNLNRVTQDPVTCGTMQVCANVMCNYTSFLYFLKTCQASHDLMNGILISLRNPLDLIEQKRFIKQENEQRKRTSIWQVLLLGTPEQNTKEIDNQIMQSHQTISDELVHFQRLHSKRMIKKYEEKQKNQEIEKQLKSGYIDSKREIKMLLLGAGESGKSTILKQMKLIHDGGFSQEERESFKEVIFSNTLQSMVVTLEAMDSLRIPFAISENRQHKLLVMKAPPQVDALDQELVDAISTLWDDTGVQECVSRASEFQLNDSAKYYFDSILRIGHPHYIPSDQDLLRSRVKTTGITETVFTIDKLIYRLMDVGGQRSERKKWIHCFEDVTTLLFLVAISEYDQVLFEDSSVNRLQESLTLFDSICNSRWFLKTSIILFLNKMDLFKEKLEKNPLELYYKDYEGRDYESACQYLLDKFLAMNTRDTKQIYTHLTCATDTQQIKFVMNAVNDMLLHKHLRDLDLL